MCPQQRSLSAMNNSTTFPAARGKLFEYQRYAFGKVTA
jgi:hypothetical protein